MDPKEQKDPLLQWFDQLTQQEGFEPSVLLVSAVQRMSLAYDLATDVVTTLREAGVQNLDDPLCKAVDLVAQRVVNYIRAEAECTRQLIMVELAKLKEQVGA